MSTLIDDIRSEMSEVLKGEAFDIDKVIELSSKLAQADTEHVRFSTDAGIINRLGRELVAKQETAVAELIKNAYDADATEVTLTFVKAEEVGGTLIIEDNGLGMTHEQLINGFMRLASVEKIINPNSKLYSRKRAGRKGIGRFAVQRLGSSLTICTQVSDGNTALRIEINWNDFVSGKDLISVSNNIEYIPKLKIQGTTLEINNLNESWSDSTIHRVYRYITELLQPFPINTLSVTATPLNSDQDYNDPGFKVSIRKLENGKVNVIADEEISFLSYALAEIEGYVDENGVGYWKMHSDRYEIHDNFRKIGKDKQISIPFSSIKNVGVKAYYFIWKNDLYPRVIFSSLREFGKVNSGIKLYRNGFRVPPYGEKQDDWLGLDASTGVRDILPPHANINFIGYVEIIDPEGINFNETSSREGLIENDAFRELQDFCARVLKAATFPVAEARNRKQTKSQRDWEKEKGDPDEAVKAAAERIKAVVEEQKRRQEASENSAKKGARDQDEYKIEAKDKNNESSTFFNEAVRLAEIIIEANAAQREKERQVLEELGMLRVLASLGLTIGEFTHEVRQVLGAAEIDAKKLAQSLGAGSMDHKRAVRLESNVKRFTTYAAYFDKAIRENISRELVSQNLKLVIGDFVDLVNPKATQSSIQITQEFTGDNLITPPMHTSELASILFNFYSNSQKAIRNACSTGRIHVRAGAEGKKVFLEFADNGIGIPAQYHERVFEAFFTTSTPVGLEGTDDEEMQGTGLGLKIVKDIVEGYGGEVYISQAPVNFTTCFRVELPLNSDER